MPRPHKPGSKRKVHISEEEFIDFFGNPKGIAFALPPRLAREFYQKYENDRLGFVDNVAMTSALGELAKVQPWYDLYNDADPYRMMKAREWVRGEIEKWKGQIDAGATVLECIQRTAIDMVLLHTTGASEVCLKHLLYATAMIGLRAVEEGKLCWRADDGSGCLAETKTV